mmetsp:Transcript_129606/g.362824  ORF Transcript_129606/g.362824 Transcript_129606/m.362824 type:complete len:208 (+) Transcript_129606:382-1005(+)
MSSASCISVLALETSRSASSSNGRGSQLTTSERPSRTPSPRMSSKKLQTRRRADSKSTQRLTATKRVKRSRRSLTCVSWMISATSQRVVGMFCWIQPALAESRSGKRTRSYDKPTRLRTAKEECPCCESTLRTSSTACSIAWRGFDRFRRAGMSSAAAVFPLMSERSSAKVARSDSRWMRRRTCGTAAMAQIMASAEDRPSTPWRST